MIPTLRRSLFILAASIVPALADDAPAPAAPPEAKKLLDRVELNDGDSFVFLGDSITHQCLYTQYVEDYFYTRLPKVHLHFHNAGVGGDVAQDALDRFDGDVAAFKPKYVTILLGMNDGAYTKYEQAIFDRYQRGMTSLLEKLAGIGATAIPMTPTMFDSLPSRFGHNPNVIKETYYNGVLSLYGSWLREEAELNGLGFVDMWSPLNNLTMEQRKKDAKWTMIGDGVHPGPTGQVVMAEAIIQDVVAHTPVSHVTIDREGDQPKASAARGTVANLEVKDNHVAFDFTAESLPWVLPQDAADGCKLVHTGHRDSSETVTVRNLAPGQYELKIDGQAVGSYSSGQLAAGVELEENDKTPQYRQALKVAELNRQRNDQAIHPLRDLWGARKGRVHALNRKLSDPAVNADEERAAFAKTEDEMKPKVDEVLAKAQQIEDQIYQANQPLVHHYEVSAAGPAAAAN